MCERASPEGTLFIFSRSSRQKFGPCVSAPCTARYSSSQVKGKTKKAHYFHYIPRTYHLSAYLVTNSLYGVFQRRRPPLYWTGCRNVVLRLHFQLQFFGSYLLLDNTVHKSHFFFFFSRCFCSSSRSSIVSANCEASCSRPSMRKNACSLPGTCELRDCLFSQKAVIHDPAFVARQHQYPNHDLKTLYFQFLQSRHMKSARGTTAAKRLLL